MQTFLKRLFKPKAANNSAAPPADIEALDPKQPEHRKALFQILVDPQSSERKITAALTKTGSLEFIVPWYVESPPRVQALIADWIARQPGSARRLTQARGRLKDPRLQRICDQLGGGHPEPETPATLQTHGHEELERLALKARSALERRQAVEQLDDEPTLQRIAQAAKGRDKSVFQIARKKLQTIREQETSAAAIHAEIEKLIEDGQLHAATESTQLYQARFESLVGRWRDLENAATDEQRQRFHAAQAECQTRCNELAAQARQAAEVEARASERQQTLELLRKTLERLRDPAPDQIPGLSSLDAMQKTQENRWLEATRDSQVERQQQKDYEQLMQILRQYVQAVRQYDIHRGQIDQAAALSDGDGDGDGNRDSLATILETINWPSGYAEPELLSAARTIVGVKRHPDPAKTSQPVDTSGLEALLEKLDSAAQQRELKLSKRLLREAQHAAERLPEAARRRFNGRLTLLARQVQDLQDWQGFATRPKQEALCEQMEQLADQHLEPELKATKIQELQQQWRDLGGSSDQLLWQRFKQAADQAFEPCQAYFEARNQLKTANLHKREQLCDQLAMFVSQVDWTACDWRGVEKIHRKAREEWRETKPIDFRRNRDVQRRFDTLLKEMDSRLDGERERNGEAKADIVARAQALMAHEPLGEAIEQAKALQKDWTGIGITDPKKDRLLWQSFRAACDKIFARRDSQLAEQRVYDSEQLQSAEALLEQVTQDLDATDGFDPDSVRQKLQTLRQLDLPRGQQQSVQKRIQELQERVEQKAKATALAAQKQQWRTAVNSGSGAGDAENPGLLPELCIRAEILAGLESPLDEQKTRMTLQVERLAAGMGQGKNQNFRDARAEMDHLVERWQAAAGGQPEPGLVERMNNAIDAVQF